MLEEIFFFLNGEVANRDGFLGVAALSVCFFGVTELTGSRISKLWGVEIAELSGFGGSWRAREALTARVFRARARFRSMSGSTADRPSTSFFRPSSTCHRGEGGGIGRNDGDTTNYCF